MENIDGIDDWFQKKQELEVKLYELNEELKNHMSTLNPEELQQIQDIKDGVAFEATVPETPENMRVLQETFDKEFLNSINDAHQKNSTKETIGGKTVIQRTILERDIKKLTETSESIHTNGKLIQEKLAELEIIKKEMEGKIVKITLEDVEAFHKLGLDEVLR